MCRPARRDGWMPPRRESPYSGSVHCPLRGIEERPTSATLWSGENGMAAAPSPRGSEVSASRSGMRTGLKPVLIVGTHDAWMSR